MANGDRSGPPIRGKRCNGGFANPTNWLRRAARLARGLLCGAAVALGGGVAGGKTLADGSDPAALARRCLFTHPAVPGVQAGAQYRRWDAGQAPCQHPSIRRCCRYSDVRPLGLRRDALIHRRQCGQIEPATDARASLPLATDLLPLAAGGTPQPVDTRRDRKPETADAMNRRTGFSSVWRVPGAGRGAGRGAVRTAERRLMGNPGSTGNLGILLIGIVYIFRQVLLLTPRSPGSRISASASPIATSPRRAARRGLLASMARMLTTRQGGRSASR